MSRKSSKEQEIWKPVRGLVTGWPYEVSNKGRVRRVGRGMGCTPGRIMKASPGFGGYKAVTLKVNGDQERTVFVHKLVAEAFIGVCPVDHEVNHKDTHKLNNRSSNLEYVTHQRNCQHAGENGLLGAKNPKGPRKLTEEKVKTIWQLRSSGMTQVSIAAEIGVSQQLISSVLRCESWGESKPSEDINGESYCVSDCEEQRPG